MSSGGVWDRLFGDSEAHAADQVGSGRRGLREPFVEEVEPGQRRTSEGPKTDAQLTKEAKHKKKIAKSQRLMRELERTVGVRYAVNTKLVPLVRGEEFPVRAFLVVMKSLDGGKFQIAAACEKAPATLILASTNNAAAQPTVTRFRDEFCAHFEEFSDHSLLDDDSGSERPQSLELSLASVGLLQQMLAGMFEGFLRNGTPTERRSSTVFVTKNPTDIKHRLRIDDLLVGFFYVCDRNGVVHTSGRCDEDKIDLMIASVEEVIAAEEAAEEAAVEAAKEAAAEEERKKEEEERLRKLGAEKVAELKAAATRAAKESLENE